MDIVVGKMPGDVGQLLRRGTFDGTWHPFSVLMAIDRALIETIMNGDARRMRGLGAAVARHDLPSIYKVVVRLGSPGFVLKSASTACRLYFKETALRSVTVAEGHVQLSIVGRHLPLYLCEHGVTGFIEEAVRLSGGQVHTCAHHQCVHREDGVCSWDVKWS